LSIDTALEKSGDLTLQVVVYDILEVNSIKIIGPWMECLEALMLQLLLSISFDIALEELERGLVGLDWVAQVISVDLLLSISQERANCLHA